MPVPHLTESQAAAFAVVSATRSAAHGIGPRAWTTAAQLAAAGVDSGAMEELVAMALACPCVIEAPAWSLTPWGLWVAGEMRERARALPDELRERGKWGVVVREHWEMVEIRVPGSRTISGEDETQKCPTEIPHYSDAYEPDYGVTLPQTEHESYHGVPESIEDRGAGPEMEAIINEEYDRQAPVPVMVVEYHPDGSETLVPLKVMGATVMEDRGRKGKGGKGRRRAG